MNFVWSDGWANKPNTLLHLTPGEDRKFVRNLTKNQIKLFSQKRVKNMINSGYSRLECTMKHKGRGL